MPNPTGSLPGDDVGPPTPPPGASNKPLWRMPAFKYRHATRPSRSILVEPNYRRAPLPLIGEDKPQIIRISPKQTLERQARKARSRSTFRSTPLHEEGVNRYLPASPKSKQVEAPLRLQIQASETNRLEPKPLISPSDKPKIQRISAQGNGIWTVRLVIPESQLRPLR